MLFRRLALVVLALVALAGCHTTPPQQRLPTLSFSQFRPYRLNVGQIEVVSEFQAPLRDPHIEHVVPLPPEEAAKRWVQERLQPMGTHGFARFIIRDARFVERPLQVDKGIKGLFKTEQEARYEAGLDVVVQILDDRHMPLADVQAKASRSRTLTEGTTLNQRDRVWYEMSESLIMEINTQLDSLLPQYLGK
ncbi:MAG: hypothetical protein K2Q10_05820, partial [Rhodospirillales bacterium]|nr:hypothetical protein [Rhodospirillales bacterium]